MLRLRIFATLRLQKKTMKKISIILGIFALIATSCATQRRSTLSIYPLQELTGNINSMLIAKYLSVDTASFRQLEYVRSMNLPINFISLELMIEERKPENQGQRSRINNIEQAIRWLEVHSTNSSHFGLYKLSHYKQVEDGFLVKGRMITSREIIQHYCLQPIRWIILLIDNNHNIIEIKRWEIDPCPNKPAYEINVTLHFPEFENADVRFPELKNGTIYNHFSENLRYSVIALENHIQGIVKVSFIVEADSSISNIEIIQSADPLLSREVVRCIMMTDGREFQWDREHHYFRILSNDRQVQWIPGMKNGEKIPMEIIVEVEFSFDLGDYPWFFRKFRVILCGGIPISDNYE